MARVRTVSSWSLLALGALVASACAGTPPASDPFVAQRGGDPVLITVDNQDYRDATLFADWNGVRHRVGMVTGKTTETLSVAWREYQVRLAVDFVGGGGFQLDPMGVVPGDHLDVVIQPGW